MAKFFKPREAPRKPSLPPGVRIYAIGDIHGRADLLQELFNAIEADMRHHPDVRPVEIYLGDYIDRGPDSMRVLDLLIARKRLRETIFLKGNHEAWLLELMENPGKLNGWYQYGGLQTLSSYGLKPRLAPDTDEQSELIYALGKSMPGEHLKFLKDLTPAFSCGDFFFVHAGVRPGISLDRQNEHDLLWIRDEFLESTDDFGKYIVHGHTPVSTPDIRPNRINIDTGAYATGNLTLLSIEGTTLLPL